MLNKANSIEDNILPQNLFPTLFRPLHNVKDDFCILSLDIIHLWADKLSVARHKLHVSRHKCNVSSATIHLWRDK